MIEYPEPTPIPREPHELPALLEQAACDVAADFGIWRFQSRRVLDTHQMPAQEAWLRLLASMEALEGVLCEMETANAAPRPAEGTRARRGHLEPEHRTVLTEVAP